MYMSEKKKMLPVLKHYAIAPNFVDLNYRDRPGLPLRTDLETLAKLGGWGRRKKFLAQQCLIHDHYI